MAAAYKYEVERRHRSFILDENTESNLTQLALYITSPNPKFGVMCCGTCGNGKTTILYAFQRVINYLEERRHFEFLSDEYMRFKASLEIFRAKELAQISKDHKAFKDLMSRPMLAIDDLGTEPAEVHDFANINTPVIDLIDYRYNHQLFTFITTNLIAKKKNEDDITIRVKYGDRTADRLNEMLHVIVFKNLSYRK